MKAKTNIKERTKQSFQQADKSNVLTKQNIELKQKITELEAALLHSKNNSSIDREKILNELRVELEKEQGTFQVNVYNIRPSNQCRKTILPLHIEKRAQSLLEHGQMESLILIPLAEERQYEIEDGEITWHAARLLVERGNEKWQLLKAVATTRPIEDDANKRSLIHHRHAENLNNLDYAEAILKELKKDIPLLLSDQEIQKADGSQELAYNHRYKKIIGSIANKLLRIEEFRPLYEELKLKPQFDRLLAFREITYLDTTEKQVLEFFYRWQEDNINTFYRTVLPTVFISDYLKKAIRHKGLSCTLALILDKIQDSKQQQELTKNTIKYGWLKTTLKKEINRLKNPDNDGHDNSDSISYQDFFKQITNLNEEAVASYSTQQKQDLIKMLKEKLTLLQC